MVFRWSRSFWFGDPKYFLIKLVFFPTNFKDIPQGLNAFYVSTLMIQKIEIRTLKMFSKAYLVRLMMSRKEHEEYQGKLCFICLGKCTFSPISKKHKDLIFKHVYPEVCRDETWLPRSLCSGCTRKLTSQETKSPRKFSEFPN